MKKAEKIELPAALRAPAAAAVKSAVGGKLITAVSEEGEREKSKAVSMLAPRTKRSLSQGNIFQWTS